MAIPNNNDKRTRILQRVHDLAGDPATETIGVCLVEMLAGIWAALDRIADATDEGNSLEFSRQEGEARAKWPRVGA